MEHDDQKRPLYWGYFDGRAPIQKHGKWAETEYVLCDHYVPYAVGGGYVLSGGLVRYISTMKDQLSMYNSEDVSMGSWLAPFNLTRVHDKRFDTEWRSRGCQNAFLVVHKQSIQDMQSKHALLQASGNTVMCEQETRVAVDYMYEWDALPSKCCPDWGKKP
eukprot:m.135795 g.135795  ORF g.135795 m.135795 type:complete len:161 (-) comp13984_c0_seq5:310-792(-)